MARAKNKPKRLRDLLITICLILVAVVATVTLRPNFLIATLLFFGLPAAFLLWRKPSNLLKATLAAFLLGTVWGFSFDYIAEFNKAWGWSTNTGLALPLHFFGVVSLDILVWYFLWVFLTIVFYEYFAEYDFSKRVSPNYKKALIAGLVVIPLVVGLSKIAPALLTFQYAYLWLGSMTLIPFAAIVLKRPSIFPKVLEIVPFFILLYLAFELTALHTGLWSFPGHYIGTVSVMGLTFPLEEMIFWVVISSAVTAAYHEFVVDDWK